MLLACKAASCHKSCSSVQGLCVGCIVSFRHRNLGNSFLSFLSNGLPMGTEWAINGAQLGLELLMWSFGQFDGNVSQMMLLTAL